MSKLTAIQIRNLKPKDKPFTLADGGGLSVHVTPAGVVSWRYRYRYNGKATTQVLGNFPEMTLAEARSSHQRSRSLLRDGVNPTAEKKLKKLEEEKEILQQTIKSKNTFQAVAEDWIEQQGDKWGTNHTKAVLKTLERDAFPSIGDTRIDTLTPPQILTVIRTIEARGSYEIASKVLQRIAAVCRYAVQTGMAMYNPAADMRGVLKTRRVVHRAALQENELSAFLQRLHSSNEHVITKAALLFTIHTAARTGEVRFAIWKEIDISSREWRIPAERMKMKLPHTVPLTDQTVMILEAMRAHSVNGDEGLIFPGIKTPYKPLSENTMLYAMYRLGYHSRATVHGFRAVFSTIANESGLFDKDAIERQLAHQEGNKVRAAYHRSEYLTERRKMMEWWSAYLEGLKK
ncbi:MAG: integrase arm-type DNA-binding domain-containing protein [Proteobacteria bacterium]|nr:integrase arm-type DNA-binding domain-containing protein [Pseudomonadota bacterium]